MMDTLKILKEIHRENLCTYFVLPLLQIGKSRFADESNFLDSYLTPDLQSILVSVAETTFFKARMENHPQYLATWSDKSGGEYIQYSIPARWANDVLVFSEGKYSRMSVEAKEMIQKYSELQYRVRRSADNVPITDIRLLALDRSIAVRELWEHYYDVCIPEQQELLSGVDERSYIDLKLLTKNEQ